MIELLSGFPGDVLAAAGRGEVSEDDYRKTLIPAVERMLKEHARLRVFFQLGDDFKGFTLGAAWEDTKLGLGHWRRWGRIAVVTDVNWVVQAMRLFSPLFHHPVRTFANADYQAARTWICEEERTAKAA